MTWSDNHHETNSERLADHIRCSVSVGKRSSSTSRSRLSSEDPTNLEHFRRVANPRVSSYRPSQTKEQLLLPKAQHWQGNRHPIDQDNLGQKVSLAPKNRRDSSWTSSKPVPTMRLLPFHDRRHSSANIGPTILESQRRTSTFGLSAWQPWTQARLKQSEDIRNYSRPFAEATTHSDYAIEVIQLSPPAATFKNPFITPSPSFSGSENGSTNSNSLESHLLDAKDYDRLQMYATNRRRASCVLENRRKSVYTIQEEKEERRVGKRRLKFTKWLLILIYVVANGVCIGISWAYPKLWFICECYLFNILGQR